MLLEEFHALPAADAAAVVRPCADVDRWVGALVAARPYAALAALLDHAAAHAVWTDEELDRALAGHPRIGERATGTSATEQAGVDDAARQAFVAANRHYEERFGRIYLVRAAGRTGEEMLALLEERLGHDDATERETTKQQLTEIALLRLQGLFQEDPSEEERR